MYSVHMYVLNKLKHYRCITLDALAYELGLLQLSACLLEVDSSILIGRMQTKQLSV